MLPALPNPVDFSLFGCKLVPLCPVPATHGFAREARGSPVPPSATSHSRTFFTMRNFTSQTFSTGLFHPTGRK